MRRCSQAGISPDRASVIRLGGTLLLEPTDEWAKQSRHLGVDVLARSGRTDEQSIVDVGFRRALVLLGLGGACRFLARRSPDRCGVCNFFARPGIDSRRTADN